MSGDMDVQPTTARQWQALFGDRATPSLKWSASLAALLYRTYGPLTGREDAAQDPTLEAEARQRRAMLERRAMLISQAIDAYVRAFPHLLDEALWIVRCPARVNLRGMHIDSHGGGCNALAVPMETFVLLHPHAPGSSDEHRFIIKNSNPTFEEVTIDANDLQLHPGWSRYLVGVLEALTEHNKHQPLRGFSGFITSDVPTGAGISSSHSLVMAFMKACLLTNPDIDVDPIAKLEMARAAEGKAGAVTGLGDQGAMLFAREGHILHTCFYQNDHSVIQPSWAPFPEGHVVVVANSMRARNLSGKEAANYAVPRFAYSVALGLFKEIMKREAYDDDFVKRIDRLSRISPLEFKGVGGTTAIYRLLLQIPERITVSELIKEFPSLREVTEKAEQTYLCKLPPEAKPSHIDLRGPLLFGISECERARQFFTTLQTYAAAPSNTDEKGTLLQTLGDIMTIGHNGDSVTYAETHPISDAYLQELIHKLAADCQDPSAQLYAQPGAFNASVPELDQLQQIMCKNGALGASLTGAGMGGVVVGIVRANEVEALRAALETQYYAPKGVKLGEDGQQCPSAFFVCFPISGVGHLGLLG